MKRKNDIGVAGKSKMLEEKGDQRAKGPLIFSEGVKAILSGERGRVLKGPGEKDQKTGGTNKHNVGPSSKKERVIEGNQPC